MCFICLLVCFWWFDFGCLYFSKDFLFFISVLPSLCFLFFIFIFWFCLSLSCSISSLSFLLPFSLSLVSRSLSLSLHVYLSVRQSVSISVLLYLLCLSPISSFSLSLYTLFYHYFPLVQGKEAGRGGREGEMESG